MTDYARFCPRCRTRRPLTEILCEGVFESQRCNWSLLDVLPTTTDAAVDAPSQPATPQVESSVATDRPRRCRNGHDLAAGDFLCMVCGERAAEIQLAAGPASSVRLAAGWEIGTSLPV